MSIFSKKPFWKFLFLVLLPAVFVSVISFQNVFKDQENLLYDICLQLRPLQKISPNIAVIEIDDITLNHLGQWPLPRDFHASLVDILHELGAKTIVFDLIFTEPTDYDPIFAKSIERSGRVYLPEVISLSEDVDASEILDRSNVLLAPLTPVLDGSVAGKGHINVLIDPDGKIRRVPVFVRDDKRLIPQLGLRAACDYLDMECNDPKFFQDHIEIDGRLNIPVSNTNEMLVNYPGKWKESFTHFSYLEILAAYKDWKIDQKDIGRLAELKDKACFIGLTAAGTVDLKSSPLENKYPMLGLNVSIFNSVVEKSFLFRASREANVIFAFLIYIICLFICFRCRPWVSFLNCVLLAVLCCASTGVSLIFEGVWVDLFFPLLIILLVYLVCVSLRWARERYQREVLEKEMSIARDIQMQFLVSPNKDHEEGDVAIWFKPAQYVAGDFYDVFPLEGCNATGIILGDVSGKGLPAALCMAQAISLFRIFARQQPTPEETLIRLNQELYLRGTDRFATALYCIIDADKRTVRASSAGHGPMFIYRDKEKKIEEISLAAHAPLAAMDDTAYEGKEVVLNSEDKLFLFSDGISEARNKAGKEFGVEKIKEIILSNAVYSNEEVLDNLTKIVVKYIGQSVQHDDMTMIIFSFKS